MCDPSGGVNWTRISAVVAVFAAVLAVPGPLVAVDQLRDDSNKTPANDGSETLSPSGQLRAIFSVQRKGERNGWRKEVRGVSGDVVQGRVRLRNDSDSRRYENVAMRVVLAPHLSIIGGSVRLVDAEKDVQQKDAPAFGDGYALGRFIPGSTTNLIFDTRLESDFEGCATRLRNYARFSADGLAEERHRNSRPAEANGAASGRSRPCSRRSPLPPTAAADGVLVRRARSAHQGDRHIDADSGGAADAAGAVDEELYA